MRGFAAFLGKELREIFRTWRIWVIPGIVLFFALTTPLLTKLTPVFLQSMAASQPGTVIKLPDPTFVQAYQEYASNLSEVVAIAILVAFAGSVSGERRSGTAALVLTKPVSRTAFIVAKVASQMALVGIALAIGGLVMWAGTLAVFGTAPAVQLLAATALWAAFGTLLVAVATLLSVLIPSPLGAAGLGVLAYALIGLGNIWPPLGRYGPGALIGLPVKVAAGESAAWGWPVLTALLLAAALAALATYVFREQEL